MAVSINNPTAAFYNPSPDENDLVIPRQVIPVENCRQLERGGLPDHFSIG